MNMTRRQALALAGAGFAKPVIRAGMRSVPEPARFTVAQEEGWYLHSAGVAAFDDELVCTYRRSDAHLASEVETWCARSRDGGRTWTDPKRITRLAYDPDRACWVAPQLSRTRDGRLVLIIDRGEKLSKFDWPMLSQWQMKDRGMSNWLLISRDRGRTWDGPRKIDDVGGEPSFVVELSNGAWMYTRTESKPTTEIKHPTPPWGPNYYLSMGVFSFDQGKTWSQVAPVADSPLHGDCEVGVVELEPGHLLAATRIGDGGGRYGQPSRLVHSYDYGKTWSKPVLAPFYGQRPIPGKLKSGKVLVTYRNAWGTPASYAFVFDPGESFEFQPNSWIWDESRCRIRNEVMEIQTADGRANGVEFGFYPVEDDDSAVEVEAELLVREAEPEGCLIGAGAWVRFEPRRVSLADRPADGFDLDTTRWRRYRIASRDGQIRIYVDGELKLRAPLGKVFSRIVRLGSRGRGPNFDKMRSLTLWRSLAVKVTNRRDYSIDWKWTAAQGYPDQFRRNRMVCLERNGSLQAGDGGYSGWAQRADGGIVIVDYTRGDPPVEKPLIRAYLTREEELI
jgi:hypothetical protein